MKVFISHKQEDEIIAKRINLSLKLLGVASYLDLLDPSITNDGKALTDHIKSELKDCTDIMVIMSEHTRISQWVPFEIGMSAQLDMPTVTYLSEEVQLPSFLEYWPRLRKLADIDTYINSRQTVAENNKAYLDSLEFVTRKRTETEMFYRNLKQFLGQA